MSTPEVKERVGKEFDSLSTNVTTEKISGIEFHVSRDCTPLFKRRFFSMNLDRRGSLSNEKRVSMLNDIALGVQYLHKCSPIVVHKTNNMLLYPGTTKAKAKCGVATLSPEHTVLTQVSRSLCYAYKSLEAVEPTPLTNCEVVTLPPGGSQCIKIPITLRVEPQDGSPHTESEQNGRESFASEKNSPENYWKASYQEVFANEEEEQLMCVRVRVRACDHVHIVDGIEVSLNEEKVKLNSVTQMLCQVMKGAKNASGLDATNVTNNCFQDEKLQHCNFVLFSSALESEPTELLLLEELDTCVFPLVQFFCSHELAGHLEESCCLNKPSVKLLFPSMTQYLSEEPVVSFLIKLASDTSVSSQKVLVVFKNYHVCENDGVTSALKLISSHSRLKSFGENKFLQFPEKDISCTVLKFGHKHSSLLNAQFLRESYFLVLKGPLQHQYDALGSKRALVVSHEYSCDASQCVRSVLNLTSELLNHVLFLDKGKFEPLLLKIYQKSSESQPSVLASVVFHSESKQKEIEVFILEFASVQILLFEVHVRALESPKFSADQRAGVLFSDDELKKAGSDGLVVKAPSEIEDFLKNVLHPTNESHQMFLSSKKFVLNESIFDLFDNFLFQVLEVVVTVLKLKSGNALFTMAEHVLLLQYYLPHILEIVALLCQKLLAISDSNSNSSSLNSAFLCLCFHLQLRDDANVCSAPSSLQSLLSVKMFLMLFIAKVYLACCDEMCTTTRRRRSTSWTLESLAVTFSNVTFVELNNSFAGLNQTKLMLTTVAESSKSHCQSCDELKAVAQLNQLLRLTASREFLSCPWSVEHNCKSSDPVEWKESAPYIYLIKVIGNPGVGKSSLANALLDEKITTETTWDSCHTFCSSYASIPAAASKTRRSWHQLSAAVNGVEIHRSPFAAISCSWSVERYETGGPVEWKESRKLPVHVLEAHTKKDIPEIEITFKHLSEIEMYSLCVASEIMATYHQIDQDIKREIHAMFCGVQHLFPFFLLCDLRLCTVLQNVWTPTCRLSPTHYVPLYTSIGEPECEDMKSKIYYYKWKELSLHGFKMDETRDTLKITPFWFFPQLCYTRSDSKCSPFQVLIDRVDMTESIIRMWLNYLLYAISKWKNTQLVRIHYQCLIDTAKYILNCNVNAPSYVILHELLHVSSKEPPEKLNKPVQSQLDKLDKLESDSYVQEEHQTEIQEETNLNVQVEASIGEVQGEQMSELKRNKVRQGGGSDETKQQVNACNIIPDSFQRANEEYETTDREPNKLNQQEAISTFRGIAAEVDESTEVLCAHEGFKNIYEDSVKTESTSLYQTYFDFFTPVSQVVPEVDVALTDTCKVRDAFISPDRDYTLTIHKTCSSSDSAFNRQTDSDTQPDGCQTPFVIKGDALSCKDFEEGGTVNDESTECCVENICQTPFANNGHAFSCEYFEGGDSIGERSLEDTLAPTLGASTVVLTHDENVTHDMKITNSDREEEKSNDNIDESLECVEDTLTLPHTPFYVTCFDDKDAFSRCASLLKSTDSDSEGEKISLDENLDCCCVENTLLPLATSVTAVHPCDEGEDFSERDSLMKATNTHKGEQEYSDEGLDCVGDTLTLTCKPPISETPVYPCDEDADFSSLMKNTNSDREEQEYIDEGLHCVDNTLPLTCAPTSETVVHHFDVDESVSECVSLLKSTDANGEEKCNDESLHCVDNTLALTCAPTSETTAVHPFDVDEHVSECVSLLKSTDTNVEEKCRNDESLDCVYNTLTRTPNSETPVHSFDDEEVNISQCVSFADSNEEEEKHNSFVFISPGKNTYTNLQEQDSSVVCLSELSNIGSEALYIERDLETEEEAADMEDECSTHSYAYGCGDPLSSSATDDGGRVREFRVRRTGRHSAPCRVMSMKSAVATSITWILGRSMNDDSKSETVISQDSPLDPDSTQNERVNQYTSPSELYKSGQSIAIGNMYSFARVIKGESGPTQVFFIGRRHQETIPRSSKKALLSVLELNNTDPDEQVFFCGRVKEKADLEKKNAKLWSVKGNNGEELFLEENTKEVVSALATVNILNETNNIMLAASTYGMKMVLLKSSLIRCGMKVDVSYSESDALVREVNTLLKNETTRFAEPYLHVSAEKLLNLTEDILVDGKPFQKSSSSRDKNMDLLCNYLKRIDYSLLEGRNTSAKSKMNHLQHLGLLIQSYTSKMNQAKASEYEKRKRSNETSFESTKKSLGGEACESKDACGSLDSKNALERKKSVPRKGLRRLSFKNIFVSKKETGVVEEKRQLDQELDSDREKASVVDVEKEEELDSSTEKDSVYQKCYEVGTVEQELASRKLNEHRRAIQSGVDCFLASDYTAMQRTFTDLLRQETSDKASDADTEKDSGTAESTTTKDIVTIIDDKEQQPHHHDDDLLPSSIFPLDCRLQVRFGCALSHFRLRETIRSTSLLKECLSIAISGQKSFPAASTSSFDRFERDVPLIYLYLADNFFVERRYREAAFHFRKASELHPSCRNRGGTAVADEEEGREELDDCGSGVLKIFGLPLPSQASLIIKCGIALQNASEMLKAVECFKRALKLSLSASRGSKSKKDELSARTSLGNIYQTLGDHGPSLEQYEIAVELAEELVDDEESLLQSADPADLQATKKSKITLSWTHGNVGNSYLHVGRKEKALFHLKKAFQITADYNPTPEALSRSHNNLGTAHQALENYDKAERHYDHALSHAIFGRDVGAQARVHGNMGNLFHLQKKFRTAIEHYSQVVELSKDENNTATGHHNRGCCYYEQAELLKRDDTDPYPVRYFGCEQHHTPVTCSALLPEEIRQLYQNSVEDFRKSTSHHESTLRSIKGSTEGLDLSVSLFQSNSRTFSRLQDCLVSLGRWKEALVVAEQSRSRSLGESLLAKSKLDPHAYRCSSSTSFSTPLSEDSILQIVNSQEHPVVFLSYTGSRLLGWLIRPSRPRFPRPCKVVRGEREEQGGGGGGGGDIDVNVAAIETDTDSTAITASSSCSSSSKVAAEDETDDDDGEDRPAISMFEVPLDDCQFDGNSFQHFVLASLNTAVADRNFDLFETQVEEDEERSREQRKTNGGNDQTKGCYKDTNHKDETTTKDSNSPSRSISVLYQILTKPLLRLFDFDPPSKIIVVPDSTTGLIPFPALRDTQSKRFLGDNTAFQLMPSILAMGVMTTTQSHELDPTATVIQIPQDRKNLCIVGNPYIPTFTHGGGEWTLGRLPHATEEAEWVGHALGGAEPLMHEGATKNAVKMKMIGAKVIHLATHGSSVSGFLAFSGLGSYCSKHAMEGNAVLLFPSDIQKLNLQSTALVVLSSCDSSRGTVKADGVIGMARAFIIAGVQAVLTTLWRVPDESAAVFMRLFYQFLIDGFKSSDALRNAILTLRCFEKFSQYAHWSGYNLIGRDVEVRVADGNDGTTSGFASRLLRERLGEKPVFPQMDVVKKLETSLLRSNNSPPTDVQILRAGAGLKPYSILLAFIHLFHESFPGGVYWLCGYNNQLLEASMLNLEQTFQRAKNPGRLERANNNSNNNDLDEGGKDDEGYGSMESNQEEQQQQLQEGEREGEEDRSQKRLNNNSDDESEECSGPALIVLSNNMADLPQAHETAPHRKRLFDLLSDPNNHVILTLRGYSQPPDKIVKYFDRVHRRGAVVSDIVSMTTTHSVQSVAYEVVRSCPEGFTPSSEDRRCFSELAEFTNSSPTLNSIASNLIVRRLKRKGSSSTCSSIIRELLPLEELKISSSSDDDDDVDSSQYQKHQPLSQSSKKKNSYTTTASSRESEGKLSVGASFLSPSKPATAVAGGVVGADEKTDLLQGDFSPSSSSSLINVQYDPWSSVLKLVRAAKLHPQAEVLLYCMSLFPCCPLPKRLVKKMAEYLVETSSGRDLVGEEEDETRGSRYFKAEKLIAQLVDAKLVYIPPKAMVLPPQKLLKAFSLSSQTTTSSVTTTTQEPPATKASSPTNATSSKASTSGSRLLKMEGGGPCHYCVPSVVAHGIWSGMNRMDKAVAVSIAYQSLSKLYVTCKLENHSSLPSTTYSSCSSSCFSPSPNAPLLLLKHSIFGLVSVLVDQCASEMDLIGQDCYKAVYRLYLDLEHLCAVGAK